MNTQENNKLIAEFMGHKLGLDGDGMGEPQCRIYEKGLGTKRIEDTYSKSWDWLMPVVEKINNTCSDKYGNYYDFQIGNGYVWVDPHIGDRIFFSGNDINHKDEPMKSKVYRGVVEFINQLNK